MKCLYFLESRCRSCNLLNKSYSDTLQEKQKALQALFPDASGLIKPVVGLTEVEHSRNKAKLASFNQDGELCFGLTDQWGEHRELEACPLHAEGINALLPLLKEKLIKYNIPAYDLKTKKGELKFLLLSKSSHEEGQYLIRFVLRSRESLDRLKKAALELVAENGQIKVVTANIQPVHQAILEGDDEIVLSPEKIIIHRFDEFNLGLGARSFFQVTPEMARKLYQAVAQEIARNRPQSLLELYCGVGAFAFYASRACPDVTGVEISKEAIDCAKTSAQLNNLPVTFIAGDVENFLNNDQKNYEALIVNPPRRGLNLSIIENIKKLYPQFIYYSSCNAVTLARDFQELQNDYEIKSLQIFDMFPFTSHYETLMCLEKRRSSNE